jgi:hypothetical protein
MLIILSAACIAFTLGKGSPDLDPAIQNNIQALVSSHTAFVRTWTKAVDGIESNTTTTDVALAATLQTHVAQMQAVMKAGDSIRACDPLFAALHDRYVNIELIATNITGGVFVQQRVKTANSCDVSLIAAHAAAVSLFIEHGSSEVMMCKQHQPPACAVTVAPSVVPSNASSPSLSARVVILIASVVAVAANF